MFSFDFLFRQSNPVDPRSRHSSPVADLENTVIRFVTNGPALALHTNHRKSRRRPVASSGSCKQNVPFCRTILSNFSNKTCDLLWVCKKAIPVISKVFQQTKAKFDKFLPKHKKVVKSTK